MPDSSPAWNDAYATGNPNIDMQHRELFAMIDSLEALRAKNPGPELVGPILKRLKDYVAFHFALEEALMLRHHVPAEHADPHRAAHAGFVRKVRDFSFAAANRHPIPGDELEGLVRFLRDWLVSHIASVDKELVRLVPAAAER